MNRPAETSAGVAAALAVLAAFVFGIDEPKVVAAIAVVLGGIPAGVTWLISRRERT